VQFEAAGPIDTQALSRLAIQLFEEEQFKQLVDKGMNMQLTRSKDGATGDSLAAVCACWGPLLLAANMQRIPDSLRFPEQPFV
jgi:hypothetical protein